MTARCPDDVADPQTLEREGAVIGTITLDRRPIFDTSDPEENKRLYRLANRYHVMTRPSTIRSQLLFRPGERYEQRVIEESERLLRSKAYLYEARIVAVNPAGGVVDICVTTHDVWTLKPDLSFERAGGENEVFIELEDLNIFGTGAAVGLSYSSDAERDSTSLRFVDPQIGRSRVALTAEIGDNSDGHRRVLQIERPFFELDARWSAGVSWFDDDRVSPLYDLGAQVADFRARRRHLRVSGGRSRGLVDGWVRRWRVGLVFDESDFERAPDTALRDVVPADRKFVYPYVALEVAEDKFVETANHDQIGRTEDLYLGTRLTASIGLSTDALGGTGEAWLWAGGWRTGFGRPERDLLLLDASVSGRYADDAARNVLTHARARWYRRQSTRRLFFAMVSADAGKRLDLDNPLRLGGDSGLRGYPLAYQNGERRALLTIEQRYFTDWYPWRLLRVGGAVFADLGRSWGRNPVGSGSRGWLSDIGIGLRLASPRSSSGKVLHIDLAFPLDGDDSIDRVQLLVEGRRSF